MYMLEEGIAAERHVTPLLALPSAQAMESHPAEVGTSDGEGRDEGTGERGGKKDRERGKGRKGEVCGICDS